MNSENQCRAVDYQKYTPYILFAIFILLVSLIPGGPVETRDFSHLSPVEIWLFNGFLTLLGFGSLILIYFLLRRKKWAYRSSFIVGVIYFVLSILDLLNIFPKSSTPMSDLLLTLEVIILVLSLCLILFSYRSLSNQEFIKNKELGIVLSKKAWIILLIGIISLAITVLIYASYFILH